MRKMCLLMFVLCTSCLWAKPTHVIIDPHAYKATSDRGFFSCMDYVFEGMDHYLNNSHINKKFCGLTVDFQKRGMYYDSNRGPNWWSYYFEPLVVDQVTEHRSYQQLDYNPYLFERCYSKKWVHGMIKKYLTIKQHIITDVDNFQNTYFDGYHVVGVHYRGTDHVAEAPVVSYERVANTVYDAIASAGKPSRIFIATDEQAFLEYMKAAFDNVVYLECQRSVDGKPLHYYTSDPYETGRSALIDCLLLSRCHLLIRTQSNLSRWSTYFNPKLPEIMLSQRW